MSGLGDVVLLNAVAALLLAAAVAAGTRFVRLPAVAHVLWLLVLLRLFTPPILEVRLLPRLSEPQAAPLAALPAPLLAASPRTNLLRVATLTLWGAGSVLVLGLAAVRARRFAKLVRCGRLASPDLRARVHRIAQAMGLREVPPARIVRARIPPLLWHRPGALRLLLPEGLLERLAPAEQDALIAHELAHVLRRDHWVRYLELVATATYWWNPVVWWARHELRREEEQCCDAWVLRALGANPRDYGRALVKTLEFLAGPRVALPALACGAAGAASLKERLVMILDRRLLHVPTRLQLAALVVVASASLLVFPTWAQWDEAGSTEQNEIHSGMIELERQAMDLEAQLADVRARQIELQRGFQQRAERQELDRLRAEADRAQAEGRSDEAEAALEAAEQARRRAEIGMRQAELDRARMQDLARLETELKRAHLEVAEQELAAGASTEAARGRAAEVEAQLEARAAEIEQAGAAVESEVREQQRLELAHEVDRLRAAGEATAAERLAFKAQFLEGEATGMKRKIDAEGLALKMQALEEQVQELREELSRGVER